MAAFVGKRFHTSQLLRLEQRRALAAAAGWRWCWRCKAARAAVKVAQESSWSCLMKIEPRKGEPLVLSRLEPLF